MNRISPEARYAFATVAAALVQPLVLLPHMRLPESLQEPGGVALLCVVLVAATMVGAAVAAGLGVPAFLLMRRLGCDNWLSAGLLGFLIAALVGAFGFNGPPRQLGGYSCSQTWHGQMVDLYVNGEPTRYAWYQYAESVALFGLQGLAGALAFYAVWRWFEKR